LDTYVYPFVYIWTANHLMPSFKKKKYTEPVIGSHNNDLSKDWYVFFRFKHEGKVFKFKRREGVNRIKDLSRKLSAIEELLSEIQYDLKHGWNPLLDPKRENDYNPYLKERTLPTNTNKVKNVTQRKTKREVYNYYLNK
jgi:hypothetical protein